MAYAEISPTKGQKEGVNVFNKFNAEMIKLKVKIFQAYEANYRYQLYTMDALSKTHSDWINLIKPLNCCNNEDKMTLRRT